MRTKSGVAQQQRRGNQHQVQRFHGADADGITRSVALLLQHNDMWPAVACGSLLFLGERGAFWWGEGLCVLPDHETGQPSQNVRHFAKSPARGGSVRLWTANKLVVPGHEVAIEDWRALRAYPVIGFTTPLSPEFYQHIQARAAGGSL